MSKGRTAGRSGSPTLRRCEYRPITQAQQATDGNFYGTTNTGGVNGYGTVFKITPTGTLTILYSFLCSPPSCTDGDFPDALVQATDGNFYGTTEGGGTNNSGTIFKITPSGALTTLHTFDNIDCGSSKLNAARFSLREALSLDRGRPRIADLRPVLPSWNRVRVKLPRSSVNLPL